MGCIHMGCIHMGCIHMGCIHMCITNISVTWLLPQLYAGWCRSYGQVRTYTCDRRCIDRYMSVMHECICLAGAAAMGKYVCN